MSFHTFFQRSHFDVFTVMCNLHDWPVLGGFWISSVYLALLVIVPLVQGPLSKVYTLTLTSFIRSNWTLYVLLFILTACQSRNTWTMSFRLYDFRETKCSGKTDTVLSCMLVFKEYYYCCQSVGGFFKQNLTLQPLTGALKHSSIRLKLSWANVNILPNNNTQLDGLGSEKIMFSKSRSSLIAAYSFHISL